MTQGTDATTRPAASPRLAWVLVGILGGPLMLVALVVVLARSSDEVTTAVRPYVDAARAGRPVAPLRPTAETAEANRRLASSTDFSVESFEMQEESACVAAVVEADGHEVGIAFLLARRGGALHVDQVSTRRPCTCPESAAGPCHLAP